MIEVGHYAVLRVIKQKDFGLYLEGDEGQEILLPRQYVDPQTKVDDYVHVFIYKDSEDRIVATTLQPYATAGEVAYLKVKAIHSIGAFMDWGLAKDLLVPHGEQPEPLQEGEKYLVYVYVDKATDRVVASANLNRFIHNTNILVAEGEEVEIMVADEREIGWRVVIDNKYWGMVYRNETFRQIKTGDRLTAYIKRIREDQKIDVSLQKQGYDEVKDASDRVMKAIEEYAGFLPLTDKSSPEEIYEELQMSKKVFKKAIGSLYKQQAVALEKDGIRLIKRNRA